MASALTVFAADAVAAQDVTKVDTGQPTDQPAAIVKRFVSRSGLPVRAFPIGVDAAVIQLWVRIPATLAFEDRALLTAFAHALAEGQLNPRRPSLRTLLANVGGETTVRVNADRIVVSTAMPARHLATGLAFIDSRLSGRRKLNLATTPVPPFGDTKVMRREYLGDDPAAVPKEVLQLWAPNHPYRAPLVLPPGQLAKRTDLVRLADGLLRKGLVEVVVATSETHRAVAVLLDRHLRTRLPAAPNAVPIPVSPLPGAHSLALPAVAGVPGSVSVFVPLPAAATDKESAVRLVMAAHVGASVFARDAGTLFMVERTLPAAGAAPLVEDALLSTIDSLGTLSPSAFDRAKAIAKTEAAAQGRTVHGQVYFSALRPTGQTLSSLSAVSRADVTEAFRQLQATPRIIAKEVMR